jgi:transcriptional regulator with XRE-family HTH domain
MSGIGERIKAIIDAKGLTQRELAGIAGIHEVSVCRIISGQRQPGLPTLRKLADALGMSVSELVGEALPRPAQPTEAQAEDAAEEQVLERLADVLQAAPAPRRARILRTVRLIAKAASGGGDGRFRRPQARCAARPAEVDIIREAV